ncbi:NAD-dependent epimerase/dehydratase family protein [Leucobacter luti]|uniref:Nucleoside-diphosphate-sugar epimerase n=1 Tax=Leucobacter luti TaxID=340320 RepID=A0A4Q7TK00_9MICO|nr:NAD-dependent epimerase/dehydratase family protein [Leucobacter luti]RZT60956.1 nucleoside-diphosphate-sugar epimerase [Leucobacter luti]
MHTSAAGSDPSSGAVARRRIAVLGPRGQIGRVVVRELLAQGAEVVTVSRSATPPAGVFAHRAVGADAPEALGRALRDCSSVIVAVGLPYRAAVWEREWVPLMQTIVAAASDHDIPLTVLDNLYAYGRASGPISEAQPLAPCSRKGDARRAGAAVLEHARAWGADIVLCRAADFLGPGAETTVLPWSTITRILARRGGRFNWFGPPEYRHSFALPGDVARGLITVCSHPRLRAAPAVHLPAIAPFSGDELAAQLARAAGGPVSARVLSRGLLAVAGLFSSAAREQLEMRYQFASNYVIDDSVFRGLVPGEPRRELSDIIALARPGR